MRCAAIGCSSNHRGSSKNISFHLAPMNPEIRKTWFEFCGLPLNFFKKLYICSLHFSAECYEFNSIIRAELTNQKCRAVLVKGATPTIETPAVSNKQKTETNRTHDSEFLGFCMSPPFAGFDEVNLNSEEMTVGSTTVFREKGKSISSPAEHSLCEKELYQCHSDECSISVNDFNEENNEFHDSSDDEVMHDANDHTYATVTSRKRKCTLTPSAVKSGLEIEMMRAREKLKFFNNKLYDVETEKQKMETIVEAMKKQLKDKDKAIRDLRLACTTLQVTKEENILNRVKSELSKILSQNQIDLLMQLKKRVNWTAEEIALSFTIRYYGQSVWNLIKNEVGLPLPCLQTLRSWSSHIAMHVGVLKDVIKLMRIAAGAMPNRDRVTVLSFDEMSVEETVEYDSKYDRVVGPHKNLQVMMARGLFSNWKQPVYAAFDTKVTVAELNNVIIELFEAGYKVVGCVSDCGGGNQGLWKECGIDVVANPHKTFIEHPILKTKIYFFPDAPHLLKLIRNWLLDEGFLVEDIKVTSQFLVQLVAKASSLNENNHSTDYNSLFKLSNRHILCHGAERQNVRMAAELLSHTTSINLQRHFSNSEEAIALAKVISTVDKWFSLMNSHRLSENIISKKCLGEAWPEQMKILDDMSNLMSSLRTLKKHNPPAARTLQVFQKAILMSINSTKLLFDDMIKEYDVHFIMMYKLNQDLLENLFGQIRQNGGPNNHPSPLDSLNRLRLIILGKGLKQQLSRHHNSLPIMIKEDYVICRVFKEARIFSENDQIDNSETELGLPLSQHTSQLTLEEEDGFKYAMGFVARAVKKQHPELGMYSYKNQTPEANNAGYINCLSFGGLTDPSEEWAAQAKEMDVAFDMFHGSNGNSGFIKNFNLKKRSAQFLKDRFPKISNTIINKFIQTKINIRVRNLKKNIKECKYIRSKMRRKPDDVRSAVTRKNLQKIKHFCN